MISMVDSFFKKKKRITQLGNVYLATESEPKENRVMLKTPTDIEKENALTLEDWMRKMLLLGKEQDVLPILKSLSLERRKKYRLIWKEIKKNAK